jgi:hypothetical protein
MICSSGRDVQIPTFHLLLLWLEFSDIVGMSTFSEGNIKAGVKWQWSSLKTGTMDAVEVEGLNRTIVT